MAMERWRRLDKVVAQIEGAGRKWGKTVPLGVITEEDDVFRIRFVRQAELRAELEREGKTVKWGRLLRAPEVFFEVVEAERFVCSETRHCRNAAVSRGSMSSSMSIAKHALASGSRTNTSSR